MARDGFTKQTVERLARRVGMRCSNPDCRLPTSGPASDNDSHTNTGVAAHICAASPGGARFDASMTPEERADILNGIWLCQTHAKLIDDDEIAYPPSVLRDWKETAEHMAALEARGFQVRRASPFADIERKAPKLVAEMRQDLNGNPLVRQFVLLRKGVLYNYGNTPSFTYFFEDHEYLKSIMTIMIHGDAIYNVTTSNVDRYNFTEEFVSFLIGDAFDTAT